jgi:hypothetical protein
VCVFSSRLFYSGLDKTPRRSGLYEATPKYAVMFDHHATSFFNYIIHMR